MTEPTDAKTMSANQDRMMIDLLTNDDGSVAWVWESPHGVALAGVADTEKEAIEAAINARCSWYEWMH